MLALKMRGFNAASCNDSVCLIITGSKEGAIWGEVLDVLNDVCSVDRCIFSVVCGCMQCKRSSLWGEAEEGGD